MMAGEANAMAEMLLSENDVAGASPAQTVSPTRRSFFSSMKRLFADAFLWCALAVLLAAGAANLAALRQYPSVSMRYEASINGQSALSARKYAIERGGDDVFWPTFWHETEALIESEYGKVSAACIFFSGDAALVWPARYLKGTPPGVTDDGGCALSSALARELWGSADVVGLTVETGDGARTVRGVFEGDDLVVLLCVHGEDTSQSFTAVELAAGPRHPTKSDAENFAAAAGLGKPDSVLMDTPALLAAAMGALPIVIIIIYGLAVCIGQMREYFAELKGALLFLVVIAFALLLPGLIDALPDWMIPTRWSDFSFWGALIRQIGGNLREYLTLAPRMRDVTYKILFIKQTGIAFLSACCALSICFRRHGRLRRDRLEEPWLT